MERVRAIPGVRSAAQAFLTPVNGGTWNNNVVVDGTVAGLSNFNSVGRGFFRTLGTPVVAGRDFDDHDDTDLRTRGDRQRSVRAAVPQGPQPGRPVVSDRRSARRAEADHFHIVGVVKDTKYRDLREPFGPIAYVRVQSGCGSRPVSPDRRVVGLAAGEHVVSRDADRLAGQSQHPAAVPDDDGAVARSSLLSETADGNALGILRRPGRADCRHRALRRDVVHGRAASGGNRHPHGARGRSRGRACGW